MKNPTPRILIVLACAAAGVQAQDYSNTLGSPGLSGSYVSGITAYDDGAGESLYVTGSFAIPGVSGGTNLARWDGSAWTSVGGGLVNQYSNALTVFQGDLIAAGYFDSAGGVEGTEKLARWDGSQWHSMDAQSASFLNSMWDVAVWDDGSTGEQLYIAGNYLTLNGQAGLDHIAKWDGSAYTPVGGTIGGAVPLIVLDILPADLGGGSKLYAGGRFLNIDGVDAFNIAVWDGADWSALGGGLARNAGFAQVLHMVAWDDGDGMALYAGGRFNRTGGSGGDVISTNIAKWDGSDWESMGDGFDADVQELTVFDDGTGEALYAMGNFTNSGATSVSHIAKWNGTSWEPVGSGVNGNVFGAAVYDTGEGEALILGGGFNVAGGQAANRVASLLGAPACPADLTDDGKLNFFDVSAFLMAFNNQEPAADFTDDGKYNFFDVSAFLSAFSAGCP